MQIKKQIGWIISKLLYKANPFKKSRAKAFYSQFIGKNDLCFDVGAHLGDRSEVWLALGAKVVGVEPQPRFSAYLAREFEGNPLYFNENVALGSTDTKATLHISNLFPTLSTLASTEWRKRINDATALKIAYDETVVIQVKTLDTLLAQYGKPRFIKIDVEGYETEVLKGLSVAVPYLSFEVLSFTPELMEECLQRLNNLGYKEFNFSLRETFTLSFDTWVDAQTLTEALKNRTKLYSGDIYARLSS
ncbi:MAG: FkbM family methyltransferase [Luteibaculaceae bacterium]